ncbi:unnamed protein product [[Actinomadura] parvosata subsp. kistnae]|nr:unnamed protein product [Actinomadura parvosata subsp. kistnae]
MTVNRRIVAGEYGGPEVLRLVQEPMPQLAFGRPLMRR